MFIDKTTYNIIIKKLSQIEQQHNVEIIYAIESGSRAWGFESPDSDYDIRFIYKHDKDWYLNILPKPDVIEYPITDIFDYSGWDLRKTLFLLNKSNPVLFEWLQSPIIYKKNDYSLKLLKEIAPLYFSPISTIYHYLHMANGNYRGYLQAEMVKIKKYFYVLRPIFACMWVEIKKEAPPMEFERFLYELDLEQNLVQEVEALLRRKKSGLELGLEPKRTIINDFIEQKLEYYEDIAKSFDPKNKPDSEILDKYFVKLLKDGDDN